MSAAVVATTPAPTAVPAATVELARELTAALDHPAVDPGHELVVRSFDSLWVACDLLGPRWLRVRDRTHHDWLVSTDRHGRYAAVELDTDHPRVMSAWDLVASRAPLRIAHRVAEPVAARRPAPVAHTAAPVPKSTTAQPRPKEQARQSLDDLAVQVGEHLDRLGVAREDWVRVGKVAEEGGEVLAALIKRTEGRATTDDVIAELGDVFLAALAAADELGLKPSEVILTRWRTVAARRRGARAAQCPTPTRRITAVTGRTA